MVVLPTHASEEPDLSAQVNREIVKLRNEAKTFKEIFSDLSERMEETEELLNNQLPVINEASAFVEELKNVIHIDDVDFMWNDLDAIKTDIRQINENIKENRDNIQMYKNKLNTLTTTSMKQKESIDNLFKKLVATEEYAVKSRSFIIELEAFRTKVSALNHLLEIDEIWKQMEDHQLRIKRVEKEGKFHIDKLNELVEADDKFREDIDLNVRDIRCLKEYQEKLDRLFHLEDVDSIWSDVEQHTSQLIENTKRDEELAAIIQKNKDEVENKIIDAVQATDAAVESLNKRVKYSYWIAGGSVGLAIIELSLFLMKVI